MGIAGGENAIRDAEAWIFLDRQEQLRHRLVEAADEEMRGAYHVRRLTDAVARAEAQRGLDMLDREYRVGRPNF